MLKRILIFGTALILAVLAMSVAGRAAPLTQAQSVVTYPTDGTMVSGQVEIKGTATHPNMNFYQLRYATGSQPTADSQWIDFAIVEGKQVENDVLATWDTTQVPDGQYTVALAVWGFDDGNSPYLYFVTHLTVNNAQPVATATPEPQPTAQPLPTPTSGPTPTPVTVQQPATPTPRPTPTPQEEAEEAAATPPTAGPAGLNVPLNLSELRDGFFRGGLITLLMLSVWGAYLLVKAGIRWYLRQRAGPTSG